MPEIQKLALPELFEKTGSSAEGLSEAEAERRLSEYGRNALPERDCDAAPRKLLRQFKNFFALLLIVGGMLAITAEHLDPSQGNLHIAIALIAVVFLNAAFTYFQEHQSEQIMESFRKMLPTMVTVVRDGKARELEAAYLVPGDVIVLNEGDRVPV